MGPAASDEVLKLALSTPLTTESAEGAAWPSIVKVTVPVGCRRRWRERRSP